MCRGPSFRDRGVRTQTWHARRARASRAGTRADRGFRPRYRSTKARWTRAGTRVCNLASSADSHGRQSRPKDALRDGAASCSQSWNSGSPQTNSTSSVRGGCRTASRRAAFGLVDDGRSGASRPTQSWRSRSGRAARRADLPSSPMRLSRTLQQQTGAMGRAMCCRTTHPSDRRTCPRSMRQTH